MTREINLSELTTAIETLARLNFKENVQDFERLYCDDDINTFHGFSSQADLEEMEEDILRVKGGKNHPLYSQVVLKIANEKLLLKDRLRTFLYNVVKGKYGRTNLTKSDVILFFGNAKLKDLIELQDDFFDIMTSRLSTEEDFDLDELTDFIRSFNTQMSTPTLPHETNVNKRLESIMKNQGHEAVFNSIPSHVLHALMIEINHNHKMGTIKILKDATNLNLNEIAKIVFEVTK